MAYIKFTCSDLVKEIAPWPWWIKSGVDLSQVSRLNIQGNDHGNSDRSIVMNRLLFEKPYQVDYNIPKSTSQLSLTYSNMIWSENELGLFEIEINGVPGTIPILDTLSLKLSCVKVGPPIYPNGYLKIFEFTEWHSKAIGILIKDSQGNLIHSYFESKPLAVIALSLIADLVNTIKSCSKDVEVNFYTIIFNELLQSYTWEDFIDVLTTMSDKLDHPQEEFNFLFFEFSLEIRQTIEYYLECYKTSFDFSEPDQIFSDQQLFSLSELKNGFEKVLDGKPNKREKILFLEKLLNTASSYVDVFRLEAEDCWLTHDNNCPPTLKRKLGFKYSWFSFSASGQFFKIKTDVDNIIQLLEWIEEKVGQLIPSMTLSNRQEKLFFSELRILANKDSGFLNRIEFLSERKVRSKEKGVIDRFPLLNPDAKPSEIIRALNKWVRLLDPNLNDSEVALWIYFLFLGREGFKFWSIYSIAKEYANTSHKSSRTS